MTPVTRRAIVQRGLLGGLLLLLGGGTGLALLPSRKVVETVPPLLALTPSRFQVLVAFAARAVPAGADAVAVALGVDRTLSYGSPEVRQDLDRLLGLFENALPGLLFDGRALPFTRLSPEGQDAVLESWLGSRLALRRTGFQALRKLCLAAYWVEEQGWPGVGYAPPSGLNRYAYDDSKVGTPEWIAAQPAEKRP